LLTLAAIVKERGLPCVENDAHRKRRRSGAEPCALAFMLSSGEFSALKLVMRKLLHGACL